jgi:superfamily II DNA or RNA helicase
MTKKGPGRSRRRRAHGRARPEEGAARPVPLHKRSASHFERGDRQRGEEYFADGRVELQVEGSRALARVKGNERELYRVGIDWSRVGERVLHAFCECQRFAEGKPCKHVWATLLALAESGPDQQPPGKDRLSLRKDRAAGWRDLGVSGAEERDSERRSGPLAERGRPGRRGQRTRQGRERPGGARAGHLPPSWQSQLAAVREAATRLAVAGAAQLAVAGHPPSSLRFLINTAASLESGGLILDLFEPRPAGGGWKRTSVEAEALEDALGPATATRSSDSSRTSSAEPSGSDRPAVGGALAVVTALPGTSVPRIGRGRAGHGHTAKAPPARVERLRLPARLYASVLPGLCEAGMLAWWDGRAVGEPPVVSWDHGPPWRLALRLEVSGGAARLSGALERNGERVPLSAPVLLLAGPANEGSTGGSLVLFPDRLGRLEARPERDLPWISLLRETGEVAIPRDDLGEALATLLELPALPPLETPEGLELAEERSPLQPRLVLEPDPAPSWTNPPLLAELFFVYGEVEVSARDPRPAVVDVQQRSLVRRDLEGEHRALVRLVELGLRPGSAGQGHNLELNPRELAAVAEPLLQEGWEVEVHGRALRPPGPPALRIESGIDWFELRGGVEFAGSRVEMEQLLSAVSRGDRFVQLADGSRGLLPASWMEAYGSLAQLAHGSTEDGLRFVPSQALLVDALLAALPPADVDRAFAELREKLRSFDRITPKKEPRGFVGTLRSYQRDGLGWLDFMREFGLGGVLADDMGLGKTVQVLALLELYRTPARSSGLPSLVVAPRSLVYNWIDEAQRSPPRLKVVQYHGPDREALQSTLGQYDLVVTTYGTLRRDVGFLAKVEFDTVVLDEAQAIKNPASESAKAARLLDARHRLALTGTPVENHLGELGSLFEFLNPGLLGRLPALDALSSGRTPSEQELALVARGMRPFILRRTKAQVLPDLPPKTEQVLFCELGPGQRELYDGLRASYQATLLEKVESQGLAASSIQVLEALLRLRQVACHPGLVKEEWEEAGSAKLDALFDQVDEVLDEGHKVIIFSQFTKLLGYVRRHLDRADSTYAYLDGQTRNRGEVVERFQTDPSCNLFLISLKAGGVGLNLTAAGYVYLLDPWWNPAVEAQAIDRAHRIGQAQPVFAYRMIAQDTVEEKMLELQRSKRQLAEAILEGEAQPLGDLTAEDLRLLLS